MDCIETRSPVPQQMQAHASDILLDIETTGLRRNRDFAWVIGLGTLDDKELCIRQYFCASQDDEPASLAALSGMLRSLDPLRSRVVSYNGASFDLPFLEARAKHYGMSLPFPPSLDLYRALVRAGKFLTLPVRTLRAIEEQYGIFRHDPLSGKDTMRLYAAAKTDRRIRESLLRHNLLDVENLLPLMRIPKDLEDICALKAWGVSIEDYRFRGDTLRVDVHTETTHIAAHLRRNGIMVEGEGQAFTLHVPTQRGRLPDGTPAIASKRSGLLLHKEKARFPSIRREVEEILPLFPELFDEKKP